MHPRTAALLRHELRLIVRYLGLDGWAEGTGGKVALLALVQLLLHLIAWLFVVFMPDAKPNSIGGQVVLACIGLAVFALLLGYALNQWVEALFLRRDLDLLLSAPVRPAQVLMARTLSVFVSALGLSAMLLLPVANVGVLTGRSWLGGLYMSVPVLALLASTVGLLLGLLAVRMLGVARARTTIQVLAILTGGLLYVFTQWGLRWVERWVAHAGDLPVLVTSAASATSAIALGSPLAMALGLPVTFALLGFAWHKLGHVFGQTHQAGESAARPARVGSQRFSTGLLLAMLRKEWRCLLRDPLVLSRLALSLFYIAPAVVVFATGGGSDRLGAVPAAFTLVFAAGLLGMQLAHIFVNADETPDLTYGGARALNHVLTAKLVSAVVPCIGLATGLSLLLVWHSGTVGLVVWPYAALAVLSTAALVTANVRLVPRDRFGQREGQMSFDIVFIAFVLLLAHAGAAAAAAHGWWLVSLPLALLAAAFPAYELAGARQRLRPWLIDRRSS
ncbi:MAG: hypothetical protein ACK5WG_17595 [Betaproteobacteria bacterium]